MSNSPAINSSSYSDAASYGVQEVIAKGWPMPMHSGGKRKHTTNGICKLCKKRHQKASVEASHLNTPSRLDALKRTDVRLSVKH